MEWNYDDPTPTVAGWYATLHCWDIMEGVIPRPNYWNGNKWDEDLPFTAWAGPFDTMESAEKWADDNDPDL